MSLCEESQGIEHQSVHTKPIRDFHLWVSKIRVNKTPPPLFKPKILIFLWGFLLNS